jgi:hypothetical protein
MKNSQNSPVLIKEHGLTPLKIKPQAQRNSEAPKSISEMSLRSSLKSRFSEKYPEGAKSLPRSNKGLLIQNLKKKSSSSKRNHTLLNSSIHSSKNALNLSNSIILS